MQKHLALICILMCLFLQSSFAQSPGGVSSNLRLWVKADAGVTGTTNVSAWDDQSGLSNNYTQGTLANQPALVSNNINGNPAINFSGSTTIMSPVVATANLNTTIFTVGAPTVNSNWRTMFRGATNDHPIIVQTGGTGLGYFDSDNVGFKSSGFTWLQNEVAVVGLEMRAGDVNFRKNGTQGASNATINLAGLNLNFFGNFQGNGQPFGRIAETIIYNSPTALTTTEKDRIESYLAVKYGVTLTHNYLASNGAVIWDVTTNAGYNNNITGIGLDVLSALDQQQSRSINAGADVTLNKGGAFGTDLSFIVWGDNNADNGTSTDVPGGYARRLNKVWRTAVSGIPGAVSFSIDLTDLGLPVGLTATDYVLLIDNDGVFNAGSTLHTAGAAIGASQLSFTNVTFSDGDYFTIAVSSTALKGPANVTNNLKLWLKANAGVAGSTPITSWTDQAGNGFVATAPGNAPDLLTNQINFNPAIDFTSASAEYLRITGGIMGSSSYNDLWTYAVLSGDIAQNNTLMFEPLTGGEWLTTLLPWSGQVYYDFGNGGGAGRINGVWGGTFGAYNLWTLGTSTSTTTPNGTRKVISRDGLVIHSNNNNDSGTGNNQPFTIGGGYNTGVPTVNPFDGKIAEMIIYTGVPTALEQEQIQSYLAVKYGITKNSTDIVGTVGQDERNYFASDGTVIWDFATFSSYHNRVTAIGRDDASELDQRQSKNISTNSILTLNQPGAFGSNLSFIVAGDDGAALSSVDLSLAPYTKRTTRTWRADVTGAPGSINVSFDLNSGIHNSGNSGDYALLIKNANTDFSTGATVHIAGASIINNVLTFTNVPFSDGDYFTLGLVVYSPGTSQTPVFWVKAGSGVTGTTDVSVWADQSGAGNNATQVVLANQPSLGVSDVNFNPTIDFSGNTDVMTPTIAPANLNTTIFSVGIPAINSTWRTMFRGTVSDHPIIVQAGGTLLGYFDNDNVTQFQSSGFTWLQNEIALVGLEMRAGDVNFRKNGVQGGSLTTINLAGLNLNSFGNFQSGGQRFGRIAETIIYNSATPLTTTEKETVESYLAVKYGISLSHNYLASNASVLWNTTTEALYSNRITGIGRDDATTLDQRRSKSVGNSSVLTVEKTNPSSAFISNLDYLLIGDDGGLLGATSTNVHPSYTMRVSRIWRAGTAGTPGTVSLSFDLGNGIFNSGNASDYAILIKGGDTDFTTASVHTTGASLVGNVLTFTNVSLSNNSYFTLALPRVNSPGGVVNNLRMWMKADAGVTGGATASAWADQTGNYFVANQATPANQPAVLTNRLNFNPAIQFDGTNDQMVITGGTMGTSTYSDINVFAVSRANVIQTNSMFAENVAGGRITALAPWSDNNIYWDAGSGGAPHRLQVNWGGVVNTGYLWSLLASTTSTAAGNQQNIFRNGTNIASDATMASFVGNGSNMTLGQSGAGNFFNGEISELITYTGPLSATQFNRIQSYLAIKYGITLDQTVPTNYVASNGTVLWDATANVGYRNNITVIGRDDASALDQRKSTSSNTGSVLTVEKTSSFGTDLDFWMMSDDGASLGASTTNVHPSYPMRVTRIWRANSAGTPGTIDISFDLGTGIFNSGVVGDYALLIKTGDTDFSTGATAYTGGASLVANVLTFTNVALADDDFFTLALPRVMAPGGVVNNLRMWMKADAGVTGGANASAWADQTTNSFVANQATPANQPAVLTNRLNFNPAIQFDGTNDQLVITRGIMGTASYTDLNVFAVSRANAIQAGSIFSETQASGGRINAHIPWSDNNIYWDAGSSAAPHRLQVNWGGVINTGYLWSLLASTTSTAAGNQQNIFRNGTNIASDATMASFVGNGSNMTVGQSGTGSFFNGEISELITYTGPLSATQFNRIQSYLAIKYGITLDQTVPTNYVASNGTVLWDATANVGYRNNITVIGRDDASALDQRKSKSSNTGSVLTVEKTSSFGADLDFWMMSDDGASLGASTTNVHPSYPMRVTRIWKANSTGTPGTIDISFDLGTGIFNSGVVGDYALLIKTGDTDFSTGATAYTGGANLVANVLTFTNVTLADDDFFTLALPRVLAPGGVVNGLNVWLKANAGVFADAGITPATDGGSVQRWADQTTLSNNATQTGTPVWNSSTNLINFNPTLYYNGASGHNLAYGTTNQYTVITMGRMEGTQNRRMFSSITGNALLGTWNGREDVLFLDGNPSLLTGLVASTLPRLYATTRATTGAYQFQRNGLAIYSGAVSSNSTIRLGIGNGGAFAGEASRAYVSEVIQYDRDLTAAELSRVNSYMAIKYGITLDQTVPTNYVAANGTVLWDATTNALFRNNIAGIGRDDASALSQPKSMSVNSNSIVTMDKGASFTSDLDFIVWGNDNAYTAPTTVGRHPSYPYRLGKGWRVDINGTPGTVSVSFDLGVGIYNSGVATDYALLIHTSNDFTGGNAHVTGASILGSVITFTDVNFADGDYFTLAIPTPPAPGGVVNNMGVWLKADQGVTGGANASAWADQSGNNFNMLQGNATNQPTVLASSTNFNPAIQFDGSNDELLLTGGILGTNTFTDVYAFMVSKTNLIKNNYTFYENVSGGQFSLRNPWSDNNVYWEPGNTGTNRVSANWGGNIGVPFMWGLASSTTATPSGQRQDIYRNGFLLGSDATANAFTGTNSNFSVGSSTGANFFQGEMSEMVIYRGALTTAMTHQIQSYLAIKYGITISGFNYLSSSGASIYNTLSSHANYGRDIAGIGRDDNSALSQLKSKSINNPVDLVAMANNDFTTPTAFSTTGEFLVWGHNGLPTIADVSTPIYNHGGTSIVRQLSRIWSTQKTGAPTGDVIVEVDMNLVIGPAGLGTNATADIRLLLDTDAVFGNSSGGEFTYSTGVVVGGRLYFTVPYANIPTGQGFFTIGSVNATTAPMTTPVPGGVIADIRLWLKANTGVAGTAPITSWTDQSTNGFVANVTGNGPDLLANQINSNPALDFTSTSAEFVRIENGIMGSTLYNDAWVYVVSQADVLQNQTIFYERMAGGEVFTGLIPWSDGSTYFDYGVNNTTGRVSGAWGGTLGNFNLWTLGSSTGTATPSGTRKSIARDGAVILSNNNNDGATGGNQPFLIGGGYNTGIGTSTPFDGRIAEIIVLGEVPTPLEQEKIQSYLSIKYGLSKNSVDIAGTVGQDERDLFASDGTVLWDFSANSLFSNRIAGIGRDDVSALDQRRSQNISPISFVSMDKGGVFSNDKDFLLWGSDNGLLGLTTTGAHPSLTYRLGRVWVTEVTGTPGAVTVGFDLSSGIYNSGNAADYRLLVGNSSSNFAAATATVGTFVGNVITFTGITFADGEFFTLGVANMPAPGGVVPNMQYWIKADLGVSGGANASAWADQSGNAFNVTQGTVASRPAILTNRTNFNSAVLFDGVNDQMTLAGGIMGTNTYNDFNVFAVTRVNTVQNSSLFFETQNAGGRINAHAPWGDNIFYWDAGAAVGTQRLQVAWGGAVNTNFVWGLTSSTSATASGARQEIFRNGRRIGFDNTMNAFTGNNSVFNLGSGGGGSYFNGDIDEVVMYRGNLSTSQLQKIQSYLAIKWGISLDQNTATSYYASDWNGTTGTVVWDASTSGTFRTDIAAIGRDDNSALNQKQSASINTGNVLTIGNTVIASDNATNLNNFTTDRSFFAWAHNNAALAANGVSDFGTTVNAEVVQTRLARTWFARETGTVGTLKLRFALSTVLGVGGVSGANELADVRLLIDADGVFASGATSIAPTAFDNTTDIVEFDYDFAAATGFYFTIGSLDLSSAPLPVELTSFVAEASNDGVIVTWKTKSELNNDYFVVETSTDAEKWIVVTKEKGQGTKATETRYRIVDTTPFLGSSYYRLKQVDFDGTVAYSKVVEVTFEKNALLIYPNPSDGSEVTFEVNSGFAGQLKIEVSTLQGIVLREFIIDNFEPQTKRIPLVATEFDDGMYLVTLKMGTEILISKLIIEK